LRHHQVIFLSTFWVGRDFNRVALYAVGLAEFILRPGNEIGDLIAGVVMTSARSGSLIK
jgi:hypothetical protein